MIFCGMLLCILVSCNWLWRLLSLCGIVIWFILYFSDWNYLGQPVRSNTFKEKTEKHSGSTTIFLFLFYTHAHTHACTHARTHAHTHTHTHTRRRKKANLVMPPLLFFQWKQIWLWAKTDRVQTFDVKTCLLPFW